MKGEGQEEKMKREKEKNSIWICNKLLQYQYIIYIQGPYGGGTPTPNPTYTGPGVVFSSDIQNRCP